MVQIARSSASKQHVVGAALVLSSITLLSRVLGMTRDIVIALCFGASPATDAFLVALRVPNLLRRFVAEGTVGVSFVPVFTSASQEGSATARQFYNTVCSLFFAVSITLSALLCYFADDVVAFIAPGFIPESEPFNLATSLIRVTFWYVPLAALLSISGSTLNCIGKFALPAAAPVLLNLSIICAALISPVFFSPAILGLAYAVVLGGLFSLAAQLYSLHKQGIHFRFSFFLKNSYFRKFIALTLPTLLAASSYQISLFVNTFFASLLTSGSISWLYYAERFIQFPLGVFSISIGSALLPTLSHEAASANDDAIKNLLDRALRYITVITIPATAGLIILAEPILEVIFKRGAFTSNDVYQTAIALKCYALGIWAISVQVVLVRLYIAHNNTKTPAYAALLSVLIGIFITLCFIPMQTDQAEPVRRVIGLLQSHLPHTNLNHAGIALSSTGAAFVCIALLFIFLPASLIVHLKRPLCSCIWRTTIATVVMSAALAAGLHIMSNPYIIIASLIPGGAILLVLSLHLLSSPETADFFAYFLSFLQKHSICRK